MAQFGGFGVPPTSNAYAGHNNQQQMQQAMMMQQQQGGAGMTPQQQQAMQQAMMMQQQQGGAGMTPQQQQAMQQAMMMQQQPGMQQSNMIGQSGQYGMMGQPQMMGQQMGGPVQPQMMGGPVQPQMMGGGQHMGAQQAVGVPISVGSKAIELPCGTKLALVDAATIFIAVGPTGQQFKMRPPPKWTVSTGAEAEANGAPKKMVSGCTKLSYQKMPVTGGEMWQARFLKLEDRVLSYGKTEQADEHVIAFDDIEAIELANQGDQRYKDVYPPNQQNSMYNMMTQPMGAMLSKYSGTVSKPHCLVVKKAAQHMKTIGGLQDVMNNNSALGMAFGGGMQKIQKAQQDNASRTYYFSFESAAQRDAFAAAISHNMTSYQTSPEFKEAKQREFKAAVQQVGGNANVDLTPYLDALHSP